MLNILYLYLITKNLFIYFSTIINLADLFYLQLNKKSYVNSYSVVPPITRFLGLTYWGHKIVVNTAFLLYFLKLLFAIINGLWIHIMHM